MLLPKEEQCLHRARLLVRAALVPPLLALLLLVRVLLPMLGALVPLLVLVPLARLLLPMLGAQVPPLVLVPPRARLLVQRVEPMPEEPGLLVQRGRQVEPKVEPELAEPMPEPERVQRQGWEVAHRMQRERLHRMQRELRGRLLAE